MKMFIFGVILLNLFLFVNCYSSTCMNIFSYNGDKNIGNLVQGLIKIDSTDFNSYIHVRVNLSSSETLSTDVSKIFILFFVQFVI